MFYNTIKIKEDYSSLMFSLFLKEYKRHISDIINDRNIC